MSSIEVNNDVFSCRQVDQVAVVELLPGAGELVTTLAGRDDFAEGGKHQGAVHRGFLDAAAEDALGEGQQGEEDECRVHQRVCALRGWWNPWAFAIMNALLFSLGCCGV